MRDTAGRTTVTLTIEDEGEHPDASDVIRVFDINEIGERHDGTFALLDDDGMARLILTPEEMREIGRGMHG